MKRIFIAIALSTSLGAVAANAAPMQLSATVAQEIHRVVPGANLSRLTVNQQAALNNLFYSDHESIEATIRQILHAV